MSVGAAVTAAVALIALVEPAAAASARTVGVTPAAEPAPLDTGAGTRQPLGFLLDRGRFTTIDAPLDQQPDIPQGPVPIGINNRQQLVGEYLDTRGVTHGFLLDRGQFTTVDVRDATGTQVVKINDRGRAVGNFSTSALDFDDPTNPFRGFLWENGRVTTIIEVPGAVLTRVHDIDNSGRVVGEYQAQDGRFHGFGWERGRFTTIDAPGAASTSVVGTNDRGQILGLRAKEDGSASGFVLDRGRLTDFTAPDGQFTLPIDINNRGQVLFVGIDLANPLGTIRSFLMTDGRLTEISRPGAAGTLVAGLNDTGQIVGEAGNLDQTAP